MSVKKEKEVCIGYHVLTSDGYVIVALDYDSFNIEHLTSELRRLQKDYSLSNFYVTESSSKRYHAVCFDKISLLTYKKILSDSHVDPNFSASVSYFAEPKVLRVSTKMILKKVILSMSGYRTQSLAHKQVYSTFGIIEPSMSFTPLDDGYTKLSVVLYERSKKDG